MIPLSVLLLTLRRCSQVESNDIVLLDRTDNLLVGGARPLFCATCDLPRVPYECQEVLNVTSTAAELTAAVVNPLSTINLSPGRSILHQWTSLNDAEWYAGVAISDDVLLWDGQEGKAIQLPESTIVEKLAPTKSGSFGQGTNGRSGHDISQEVIRTNSTIDLLYIMDHFGHLRVDGWKGGQYQGYATISITSKDQSWKPVVLNLSKIPATIFFASTSWQDSENLPNLFNE